MTTPSSLLLQLADCTLPLSIETAADIRLVSTLVALGLVVAEFVPVSDPRTLRAAVTRATVHAITQQGVAEIAQLRATAPPPWAHH